MLDWVKGYLCQIDYKIKMILQLYSWIMGGIYPAYMSFRAIETREDPDDDKQWLTYWIVYSLFSLVSSFLDSIFFWVPFYSYATPMAITYLVHPRTRGAKTVFNCVVKPFFCKLREVESGNVRLDSLDDGEKVVFMAILRGLDLCHHKCDQLINQMTYLKMGWQMSKPFIQKALDAFFMNSQVVINNFRPKNNDENQENDKKED